MVRGNRVPTVCVATYVFLDLRRSSIVYETLLLLLNDFTVQEIMNEYKQLV